MLRYFEGTVFNAPVKTIVNTVNCSGVMGAGIALEFKLRYPEMFLDYVEKCKTKEMRIGVPRIYEYSDRTWILNFPTKGHWKYPSKIQWIEQGLKYFCENYGKRNIESIAFPKLGTNNGGLSWDEVKILMEKYLKDLDIDVYICLDEKPEADGIEKAMVDSLNYSNIMELVEKIKIPKKQAEKILEKVPFKRFWHVSRLSGIGDKTYEKLFNYFFKRLNSSYEMNNDNDENNKVLECSQLTFL